MDDSVRSGFLSAGGFEAMLKSKRFQCQADIIIKPY